MSFPITATPTIIDAVGRTIELDAFNIGSSTEEQWGPFIFGSAQYIVGFTNDVVSPRYLGVWKRTTGEWVEVGQNRSVPPQSTAVPGDVTDGQCYFDQGNGKIWLAYRDSALKVTIVDFDCNTDKFGTPGATLTLVGTQFWGRAKGQQLFRQEDGTFYLFFCDNVTPFGLYQLTYAAGAWTGPTLLDASTNNGNMLWSGLMDSAERKHLFYQRFSSTVSQDLRHISVDSSGSPGSSTLVRTISGADAGGRYGGRGVILN